MSPKTRRKLIIACAVFLAVILICVVLTALLVRTIFIGSGNVIRESRETKPYTALVLQTSARVIITQGDDAELSVEAEDNLQPLIETVIEEGTLIIREQRRMLIGIFPTKPVIVRVTVPELTSVTLAGSGLIESDRFQSKNLDLQLSGSGKLNFDLYTEKLTTNITGSGSVTIKGNTETEEVVINGSGNYHTKDLRARSCSAIINGSGKITVDCRIDLSAEINGSGSITYFGNPLVTEQVLGSGKISRAR